MTWTISPTLRENFISLYSEHFYNSYTQTINYTFLSHTHLTADINWSVCGPSKTMQPVNQLEFSFNLL